MSTPPEHNPAILASAGRTLRLINRLLVLSGLLVWLVTVDAAGKPWWLVPSGLLVVGAVLHLALCQTRFVAAAVRWAYRSSDREDQP